MPRTRPTDFESKRRMARAAISFGMEKAGIDEETAAARINVVPRTVQNKLKRPETFSLGELWALCDALKVSGRERALILGAKEDEFKIFVEK